MTPPISTGIPKPRDQDTDSHPTSPPDVTSNSMEHSQPDVHLHGLSPSGVHRQMGMDHVLGFGATVYGFGVWGLVLVAQYGLHLTPCDLCLWERVPYICLGVVGLYAVCALRLSLPRVWPWIYPLLCACAVGLATLHLGVEHHWWPSPLVACGQAVDLGLDPLHLPTGAPVLCDQPTYLAAWVPISITTLDVCVALVGCVGFGWLARRASVRPRVGDTP